MIFLLIGGLETVFAGGSISQNSEFTQENQTLSGNNNKFIQEKYQLSSDLANQDFRWGEFLSAYGDFYNSTHSDGMVQHLLVNFPVSKLSHFPADKDNVKDIAKIFIDRLYDLELIHYPSSQLEHEKTVFSKGGDRVEHLATVVFDLKHYDGLEVEGNNSIVATFDIPSQRVVDFANYTQPMQDEWISDPISPDIASQVARVFLTSPRMEIINETPQLIYFCGPGGCQLAYKIRTQLIFSEDHYQNNSIDECLDAPIVYIDLKGNILDTKPTIYCAEISGQVTGDIYENPRYLDFSRQESQINRPFSNQVIKVWLDQQKSLEVRTDSQGRFNLKNIPSVVAIEAVMSGTRATVLTDDKDQSMSRLFRPVTSSEKIQWNWGYEDKTVDYDPSYSEEESNVYYHINRIHEYFETIAGDSEKIRPVRAIVNLPFSCAASYDDTIQTLKFFQAGTEEVGPAQLTCDSTALSSDIIYHEFGHFIVSSLISFWDAREMNNGVPDYWAATMNNDPCIAEHFQLRTNADGTTESIECYRRLDTDIRLSDVTELGGHPRGVLLSSFFWDIRQSIGQVNTDPLVIRALRLQPSSFIDCVHKLLLADDNDGNLSNGTPHIFPICQKALARELAPPSCENFLDTPIFLRGDANTDGYLDISDAIFLLRYLFIGDSALLCSDAADTNDDGQIDISDAIFTLEYLFISQQGKTLPLPFPELGADPTVDNLGCYN